MILSRVKISPQQRYDLEDFLAGQAAVRSDAKLWTKAHVGAENLILSGFSVSGVGLNAATVAMANAALIFPENTSDFSYFVSAPAEPDVTITDADLVDGVRNYIEAELVTQDGVPLTKAFWDPEANSGSGQEFNQIVNTITDLRVNFVVSTGGFSGSADRLPIAIIDTDGSGVIKVILDRREMYGRLSRPNNIDAEYAWGTKQEPTYALVMTGVTGTFVSGEQITIGGETATVVAGGTTNITFNEPTGINFANGSAVLGGTSGATGTVNTIVESFTGVDKDLNTQKEINDALMTELKGMKGTRFWYSSALSSLTGLGSFLNSLVVPVTSGALISWDGTNLTLTDSSGTPANADVIAKIRQFNSTQQLGLTRQDGTGGSATIAIADGEVLYVDVPSTGDRDYSGAGSGSTNYKVAALGSFVVSDANYWLAYREGAKLFFRGVGELAAGESSQIGDNVPQSLLDNIGLVDESTAPTYSSDIRGAASESIVSRAGVLTSAIGDEQEDRSAFLRSNDVVTWTGTQLQFTSDIVLQILNTKTGTLTEHTVQVANSPIAIADGESIYVSIDRTQAAENVTPVNSGVTPIPAQTQANKDVFVLFRRIDAAGVQVLHLPFHKQALDPGQTVRLGASGSGGSGGDAAADYKLRQSLSPYQYLSTTIFETDKEDYVDGASTGSYAAADKAYQIDSGEILVDTQNLSADFLDDEVDVPRVELYLKWKESAIDTGATYQVSRDGGNEYQTVTMERVGDTNAFRGLHTFAEEAANQDLEGYAVGNADSTVELTDTGAGVARAQSFVVTNAEVVKSLEVYLNKIEAVAGNVKGTLDLKIVRDDTGAPSEDVSDIVATGDLDLEALATGNTATIVDMTDVPLAAGTYWIVFETDAAYKASFVTATDAVSIRTDNSSPATNSFVYNGSAWSDAGGNQITHQLKGRVLDLRVKITSSAAGRLIESYGVYYREIPGVTTAGEKKVDQFYFSGDDNQREFTLINIVNPDPDLLTAYDPYRGQIYVAAEGVFRINGQKVIFEPDFFNDPGENILLIFRQNEATTIDDSAQNANKISALESDVLDLQSKIKNYAQNAEFRFWQRQTPGTLTSRQDDQYSADRWYVLTSGGAVNVQGARVQDAPTNSPSRYCGQFRQADATARQFGVAQILEADRVWELRGKKVTLNFWVKTAGISAIRAGLVEWTGAADTVTSDIVTSWAATPTLDASASFANTPADIAASSTWTQVSITTTLGQTFTNLILFVWTPNAEAQNDDIFLTQVQLVQGETAYPWYGISLSPKDDLDECLRFYEKDWNVEVPPGSANDAGSGHFIAGRTNAGSRTIAETFRVHKRDTPSVTMYSTDGTISTVRNTGAGTNVAASAGDVGIRGFIPVFDIADQALYAWHWTAEAEL